MEDTDIVRDDLREEKKHLEKVGTKMVRRSTAMPEGDKEAQVPRHGVDVAAKVGLQAAQGGHQVGPAVCASGWVRNLMNLVHQYRAI